MIDWLRRSFAPMEETRVSPFTRAAVRARKDRLEKIEARAIDSFVDSPGLTEQLLAVQGLLPRPWRAASLSEALGVPAILGAVTLISNTVGSLTMRALRNEVELPPDDRPKVIVRPDPFRAPYLFYRGTAYNMATRGEAWWWIARRDGDGNALSVLNLNPAEITVTENPRNLLRPEIRWRNVVMPNEDMRQIPYLLEPGSLRGVGPLQIAQAAISIAVESQEWAANFYADGGIPPLVAFSNEDFSDDPNDPDGLTEAERFAGEWNSKGNNRIRVVPRSALEPDGLKQFDYNPNGAQMLEARNWQVGDVARMFSMPGTLIEYAIQGSSLTYQTLPSQYDDFLRRCLRPNFLTPIEQTMSDLLPRSTVSRFDTDALTLQDPKTRYETYQIGITAGILTAEDAQAKEGIVPGDNDNAPVPFSPPKAIPEVLPIQQARSGEVRCDGKRMLKGLIKPCNAKLAEEAPFIGRCWRCGKEHRIEVRSEPSVTEVLTTIADLPVRLAGALPVPQVTISEGAVQVHVETPAPPQPTRRILERDDRGLVVAFRDEEAS